MPLLVRGPIFIAAGPKVRHDRRVKAQNSRDEAQAKNERSSIEEVIQRDYFGGLEFAGEVCGRSSGRGNGCLGRGRRQRI